MAQAPVLDLAQMPQYAPRAIAQARRRPLGAAVAIVAALGALALAVEPTTILRAMGFGGEEGRALVRLPLDELRKVETMTVDDRSQIVVEGAEAQRRNAELPTSTLPLDHVRRFQVALAAGGAASTALQCLTQAVYYESAYEPLAGRRAVAQVVLNRMRHPAYPKSVCGVVYQGYERRTGCQFSFTCDGSLLRRPAQHAWLEAQAVARAALAGYVEQSVGTATHYHADYVLPKWAFQLGKITQLGRHIFYRFNGGWGRSLAFSGQYSGIEAIPAINFAALNARLAADGALLPADMTPGLSVAPHVTDRHSESDVGGRLDVTKQWRLAIPDPVEASSRYRQAIAETAAEPGALAVLAGADHVASAALPTAEVQP